jgi:acyl carrier protein phosphodiesterase
MRYADSRGLFAAYRDEVEIMFSLQGIGRRLSRPNPLHRVADIWNDVKPALGQTFTLVFPQVQQAVSVWLQEPGNAVFAGTSRVVLPGIAKAR